MRRIFLFVCLLIICQCHLSSALICPIYSSRQQDPHHHRFIRNCQMNCSFEVTSDEHYACLGVYFNYSGQIFIKQLGIIPSDEQCSQAADCLLEMDSLNSQTFSCCCSTNNCTLLWTNLSTSIGGSSSSPLSLTSRNTTLLNKIIITEQDPFSWQLFLIISICILCIVLITFTLSLYKATHVERVAKEASPLRSSISMENLFFSAQQLVLGKNSIIYQSLFRNQAVALKVYQQTHVLVWTNEMMLLKSIQHDSIVKILSDGQYNSHLYLFLPLYENGNLQSYLRTPHRTLTLDQCLGFLRSLTSAVSYLHLGRNSTGMIIVHRDIKSSNVLVAHHGRKICLTDFGMASALPRVLTERDFVQIGTMRYMAPELLEGVIAHTAEALCSVDIYALALVMWEIISQCDVFSSTENQSLTYRAPYDEYLTNTSDRTSFAAQLYDIVFTRRLRPSLPRLLKDSQHASIMNDISNLIEACWLPDPDLRMNAQTLSFKLNQLTE